MGSILHAFCGADLLGCHLLSSSRHKDPPKTSVGNTTTWFLKQGGKGHWVSAPLRLSAHASAALAGTDEGKVTSAERGARPRGRPRAGGVVYKEKASWGCSKPRSRQRMFTSLQTRVAEDTMLCERGRCPAMRVPMVVGIAEALCSWQSGTTAWALSRTLQVPCWPWGRAMPFILQLAEPRAILGAL